MRKRRSSKHALTEEQARASYAYQRDPIMVLPLQKADTRPVCPECLGRGKIRHKIYGHRTPIMCEKCKGDGKVSL
jgi:hypothetical protein